MGYFGGVKGLEGGGEGCVACPIEGFAGHEGDDYAVAEFIFIRYSPWVFF